MNFPLYSRYYSKYVRLPSLLYTSSIGVNVPDVQSVYSPSNLVGLCHAPGYLGVWVRGWRSKRGGKAEDLEVNKCKKEEYINDPLLLASPLLLPFLLLLHPSLTAYPRHDATWIKSEMDVNLYTFKSGFKVLHKCDTELKSRTQIFLSSTYFVNSPLRQIHNICKNGCCFPRHLVSVPQNHTTSLTFHQAFTQQQKLGRSFLFIFVVFPSLLQESTALESQHISLSYNKG